MLLEWQAPAVDSELTRGLYFGLKPIFITPPSENDIFSPSRDTSFFDSHRGLFALILPYFAFLLPFYFPFSHFLSPFLLFLSPFLPFSFIFSPFFSPPFHIFSPKLHRLIFPPWGEGDFPMYRPLELTEKNCSEAMLSIWKQLLKAVGKHTHQFSY